MDTDCTCTLLYERRGGHLQATENIEHLDHFLHDLDGMVTSNKEALNIHFDVFKAVKEMVQKILYIVGTLDPTMTAGKVNSVGSFREGTKLGTPNEFDFVVEMASFENVKTISVQDECNIAGAVHLIQSDTTKQTTMDRLVTDNTAMHGIDKYLSPVKFRNQFWQLVTAVATQLSKQNVTVETKAGNLKLVEDVPQHLDMYDKGPNIEIFMVWTSANKQQKFGISVDVTPALRLLDAIPESVGVDFGRLQRYLQNDENSISDVLVIPTINLECKLGEMADIDRKMCWKLSFSLLETQIIQNMPPEHKQCLRILKHLKSVQKDGVEQMRELGLNLGADPFSSIIIKLLHSQGEMSLLTTYRMKMAVLEHDEICKDGARTSGQCLMAILKLLQQRVNQRFLPFFFIPRKNAWPRGPVVLLESSIDKIIRLFEDIMKETHYSLDWNLEQFKRVQNYVTARDGV